MNLVDRVTKLFVAPDAEWAVIKDETHTVAGLFTQYVMILAAIPAVCTFIGWSVVGFSGGHRMPIAAGLANAVITYVLTLGSVYAMALVIDFAAPHFQGERDFMQALKIAAFFPTSWWIAGVFSLLPTLAILSVVGGLHAIWLLYIGVQLMGVPEDRRVNYAAVVILASIVITMIILVVGMPLTTASHRL